ncbi:apolipoprotein N-acyltransferase, partial [Nocardioides sp.]|uniref:apolipoprotein N-acyltransferase n=1 Tax=Nocardioides sp. TaxID=35761 RepID=UPI0027361474
MQARPTVPRTWLGCSAAGALSGGFLALGFDWTALAWLSPVAIACLLLTLRGQSVRRSALVGYCFGVGFFGLLLWWMVASIGLGGWMALTVVQAAWFALAAVGTRCVAELPWSPIWVAAIWTLVELVRGQWPLGGFPWGRLGFIVVDTPWVGLLPYVGVTGAGLIVVAAAQAIAVVVRARDVRTVTVPALAAVATLLPVVFPFTVDSEESLTVGTVQGGVPGRGNDVGANHREVTRNHVSATLDLARRVGAGELAAPDIVVWPENSTAVDPVKDLELGTGLAEAAAAVGVPLLVGALVDGSSSNEVLNQGIVWSPTGPTGIRYTKHHPVPFGEYIPFRPLLGGLSERFERIPRDMKAGAGSAPLVIGGVRVA